MFFALVLVLFLLAGVRVVFEYKRALKFRFGKYIKTLQPGFRWIIPFVETIQMVDIRVITFNVVSQEVMTEDNVPCSIDGVVFFKIIDPERAVLEVEEYKFAITQLSQAALRDVCGKVELDTILSKREEMGKNIKSIVELETKEWGITVQKGQNHPGVGRGTSREKITGGWEINRPIPIGHKITLVPDLVTYCRRKEFYHSFSISRGGFAKKKKGKQGNLAKEIDIRITTDYFLKTNLNWKI